MEPYSGVEPLVGEIRALRTFRVGPGGRLYPLFSTEPWQDGENTAGCRFRARGAAGPLAEHSSPDDDCTCGFYAYGSEQAAREYPHARHVLGVVACWGRVIAGTRGLRAEHCRIEALWLSGRVPAALVEQVRAGYPSAAVYRDRESMLAEHPLTALDCYEPPARQGPTRSEPVLVAAAVAALLLGLAPADWLGGARVASVMWLSVAVLFLGIALTAVRPADVVASRRRLLALAVVLWMVAPFAGLPGLLLLRLPLVELALVAFVQRRHFLRAAGQFPADIG